MNSVQVQANNNAEGGFHFLAKEWTLARGGLTGMFTMLDQLASIILN